MAEEIRPVVVADVMAVAVAAGDSVCGGDSPLVLESARTEIPVLTEVTDRVGTVAVRAGDVVRERRPDRGRRMSREADLVHAE